MRQNGKYGSLLNSILLLLRGLLDLGQHLPLRSVRLQQRANGCLDAYTFDGRIALFNLEGFSSR